jgi:formylglycine-generating enzyme required for sulfatase activity
MVLIPAGTFTMGSPNDELGRLDREGPQHQVTLTRSFYLQTTEVTQAQWESVMGNNPSYFSGCGGDCPVETVNWWEAIAYVNQLSVAEGLPTCYTLSGCGATLPGQGMTCTGVTVNATGGNPYLCQGYRLPTEAEWEYAYRAGTTTAFYNGGISVPDCSYDANLDAIGWYCGNSGSTMHPAAQKVPNAWGLYDMSGNVLEWVWDWYSSTYYSSSPAEDPLGPESGSSRVLRGGSWSDYAQGCRAAYRSSAAPGSRVHYLGFRPARSGP